MRRRNRKRRETRARDAVMKRHRKLYDFVAMEAHDNRSGESARGSARSCSKRILTVAARKVFGGAKRSLFWRVIDVRMWWISPLSRGGKSYQSGKGRTQRDGEKIVRKGRYSRAETGYVSSISGVLLWSCGFCRKRCYWRVLRRIAAKSSPSNNIRILRHCARTVALVKQDWYECG